MFHLKVHGTEKGDIVAACDREILGETFREGGQHLHVREEFYGGEEVEGEKVLEALQDYLTANLVGNRLIELLEEEGAVRSGEAGKIEDTRHVQLFQV